MVWFFSYHHHSDICSTRAAFEKKLEFVHPVDNLISVFSDHVPSARSRRDRVRRRRRACSEGEWGHRRHVGRTVLRQLTTEVGRADTDRGPPAVSQVREGVPRSETRRLPRTYRRVWCLRANVTADLSVESTNCSTVRSALFNYFFFLSYFYWYVWISSDL